MEPSKPSEEKDLVFSPKALRLIVGTIAFLLPWVVIFATLSVTSSISASYHTRVRDIFVGALFVIGALFVAYNGHQVELKDEHLGKFWNWLSKFWKDAKDFRKLQRKYEERLVSFLGGSAAILAALFPTACDQCDPDLKSQIHSIAAGILFSAVVYFCLVGFMEQARGKNGKKAKLRVAIYWVCGWSIVVIMLVAVTAPFLVTASVARERAITFWAETLALWLFGIAWLTASKFLRFLVDDESEQFKVLDVKANKSKGKRQQIQTGA
jgi:hypothetical protein